MIWQREQLGDEPGPIDDAFCPKASLFTRVVNEPRVS
jgi:hypothetical protein